MAFSFGLLLPAFEDDRVLESIRPADNLSVDLVDAVLDRPAQHRPDQARSVADIG
jgi:hypothetical protein